MQKLSFSAGFELFVKKCNCRNLSLLQDAGETTRRRIETTVNHLFICGEPAWLAALARLNWLAQLVRSLAFSLVWNFFACSSHVAGKPLVTSRNVSGRNDLQHDKKQKRHLKSAFVFF